MAIVVEDAWQARGLGRLVMTRLVERARRWRIAYLRGDVLYDNGPAIRFLRALFEDAHFEFASGGYLFRARLDSLHPGS